MTDRVPGAPGQYIMTVDASVAQNLLIGEPVTVTLKRDDQPRVVGTPYNKASVLPDELAAIICPGVSDPTPADALRHLLPKGGGIMTGAINMGGNGITNLPTPANDADAATMGYAKSIASRKLLYTNSSPDNSFSAKEIEVANLADYAEFCVVCCLSNAYTTYYTTALFVNIGGTFYINAVIPGDTTKQVFRTFTFADGKISIGDCYAGTEKENAGLIPVDIYGKKYGILEV